MSGYLYRGRTLIEQDDKGWWCVFQLYHGPAADQLVPAEDALRVGPWPSRQIARRELRGDFRRIVLAAMHEYAASRGGRVIAQAVDGETFSTAELAAAAKGPR